MSYSTFDGDHPEARLRAALFSGVWEQKYKEALAREERGWRRWLRRHGLRQDAHKIAEAEAAKVRK